MGVQGASAPARSERHGGTHGGVDGLLVQIGSLVRMSCCQTPYFLCGGDVIKQMKEPSEEGCCGRLEFINAYI